MTTREPFRFPVLLAATLLSCTAAVAQADNLQTKVQDLQLRFEDAVKAGDWGAVAALFTSTATMLPMEGGYIQGPVEVQRYYEQSGITAIDARSGRMVTVGESVIYDIGSFTATVNMDGTETQVEGEYVAPAEDYRDGLVIRSLVTFALRQSPDAWTQ
jgi:hypothetical protein